MLRSLAATAPALAQIQGANNPDSQVVGTAGNYDGALGAAVIIFPMLVSAACMSICMSVVSKLTQFLCKV